MQTVLLQVKYPYVLISSKPNILVCKELMFFNSICSMFHEINRDNNDFEFHQHNKDSSYGIGWAPHSCNVTPIAFDPNKNLW